MCNAMENFFYDAVGKSMLRFFIKCVKIYCSCRYSYEREMYDVSREIVQAALETFEDHTTLAYASAIDLAGLIDLDLCKAVQALVPFNMALEIRKAKLGLDDPL